MRFSFHRILTAVGVALTLVNIVSAQPRGAFQSLELAPFANRSFVDRQAGDGEGGWSDQGPENSLTRLSPGLFIFNNIPFSILGDGSPDTPAALVFNSTHSATDLDEIRLPLTVENESGALYLLHTACWVSADKNEPVGSVVVTFDSGRTVEQSILTGRDVADWWNPAGRANAAVAYREQNKEALVGLYVSRIPLPADRGRPVSVALRTAGGPVWIVVAATLSATDIPLPKPEQWTVTASDEWRPTDQKSFRVLPGSALDLSPLFPAREAGADGFAFINDRGELVFEKRPEDPVRFLAASIVMGPFPLLSPEKIEAYADQIARAGYNLVRPHFLDIRLMAGRDQDLDFDPAFLDSWHRLAAALKRRGVYLFIDAVTSWTGYHAIYPWDANGYSVRLKSRIYYDPAAREHWLAGVTKLLTQVNPYTGLALKDDPQMILVQLRNEAGLHFLMSGKSEYDPGLVAPFRAWLKKRHRTTEALRSAWTENGVSLLKPGLTLDTVELPSATGRGPDTRDLQNFFIDAERETAGWLADRLGEIGVRVPFTEYNVGFSIGTSLSRSGVPLIDNHSYHDHPTDYINPGSAEGGASALASGLTYYHSMAGTRHLGRPFSVSEWGHVYWNPHRHEAGATMPAYAAFQGWQILTHFSDAVAYNDEPFIKTFRLWNDPPLRAAEYMGALLYRRGDVRRSLRTVEIVLEEQDLRARSVLQDALPSALTRLALVSSIGIRVDGPGSLGGGASATPPDWSLRMTGEGEKITTQQGAMNVAAGNTRATDAYVRELRTRGMLSPDNRTDPAIGLYESDTGEILLDEPRRALRIVTRNSEAAVLSASAPRVRLPVLEAKTLSADATVFLGSLTDATLAESPRMLLIVATDALNAGMTFTDERRNTLEKLGDGPVLSRTIRLELTLRHSRADRLILWALAADGSRRESIPLTVRDGVASGLIDTADLRHGPTPYFELVEEDAR